MLNKRGQQKISEMSEMKQIIILTSFLHFSNFWMDVIMNFISKFWHILIKNNANVPDMNLKTSISISIIVFEQ